MEAGTYRIGIRSNDARVVAGLRGLLASDTVVDDDAPPSYSLWFSEGSRELHTLYWGRCPVVRSSDPLRIVAALDKHLATHAGPLPGQGEFDARPYVVGNSVVLAPPLLDPDLMAADRRLRSRGARAADVPYVHLDLAAGVVVVPTWCGDAGVFESMVDHLPRRRPDLPVDPGRYPLARWLFLTFFEDLGVMSRATLARRAAMSLRRGIDRWDGPTLQLFGRLDATEGVAMRPATGATLVAAVTGEDGG